MRHPLLHPVGLLLVLASCGGSGGGGGGGPSFALVVTAAQPFETVWLGTSGLSAGTAQVRFFDAAGYDMTVPALSLDPLAVAVPPYLDPMTISFGAGTVSLEAILPGGAVVPVTGSLDIGGLPTVGVAAGRVTHAFISSTLDLAVETAQTLHAAETMGFPVDPDLLAYLSHHVTHLLDAQQRVLDVVEGRATSLPFGSLATGQPSDGTPVPIDAASLALADRLLCAYLAQTAGTGTARASIAPQFETEETIARSFFQDLFTGVTAQNLEYAGKLGTGIAIATGAGILAATLIGAAPATIAAIGVVGAVGWMVTTFAPATTNIFLKLGGNAALGDPSSMQTIAPEFGYCASQMLAAAGTYGLDDFLSPVIGDLGSAVVGLADAVTGASGKAATYVTGIASQLAIPPEQGTCGVESVAGSDSPVTQTFDLGRTSGTFPFFYDTQYVKDQIVVYYEGNPIFNTHCVGASGTVNLTYGGSSRLITVRVFPNCEGGTGTAWSFTVGCP